MLAAKRCHAPNCITPVFLGICGPPLGCACRSTLVTQQINQNDAVYDLAAKLLDNWDMRKTYKRDIILSLAVARCNIARDLLADQKVGSAGLSWTD